MIDHTCEKQVQELTEHYLQRVYPYELIVEAVANQNQELQQLEQRLAALGDVPQLTGEEEKILMKGQRDSQHVQREQHRKWTEESMMQLKPRFDRAQEKKRLELEEQIRLKSATFGNRLHDVNIASSLENGTEGLRYIIEHAPKDQLGNLRHFMKLYQQVLLRVQSFVEVTEMDDLLRLIQKKERNTN